MALDPRALEEKVRSHPFPPPPCSPAPQPLAPPALGQPLKLLGAQAKKTLQSASGGFSFFSNKEEKLQNAAELYIQAANAYRLEKMSEWPSPRADDPPAR